MLPILKLFIRERYGQITPPLLGMLLSLCVISNEARSDIYTFTDVSGTPNFSNVPTDERYVLALREQATFSLQQSRIIGRDHKQTYKPEIKRAATSHQIDPALLQAVIATESNYKPHAVSRKGALGLMQLMPETALRYGVSDPFNPEQNIQAGAQYLSSLMLRFNNDLPLVLAAYNSGEANVIKYGERIPPFSETRAYVPKVIGLYRKYQREVW